MRTGGERLVNVALLAIVIVTLAVLYAPLVISTLFSLVDVQRGAVLWHTASFEPYRQLWSNPSIMAALRATLLVGSLSVLAVSALATLLALYVNRADAVAPRLLELVIYIPFLVPPIVTGLALLVFFAGIGVPRGLLAVAIGHTLFVLAIVFRLVLTRLQSLPASLAEASADLGATQWQTFRHVLWPQLMPAVVTGAILALTVSIDETLITTFLAGDTMTLPLRLWAMMRVGFTREINALVTLVLLVSIGLAVVIGARLQPKERLDEE